ncbi:hypothetical protein [Mycobacterium sp. ACS1612]|uniref:hypothetical protein n=1 Tax=Mycobacterium sp. ACS1612 TaxID=1834117 RepID=UPI0012E9AA3E|nr:hypothetical protein [Mycobacterium sp. ACS1612]
MLEEALPEHAEALRIAEHAEARARELHGQSETEAAFPADAGSVDDWVAAEVARRQREAERLLTLEVISGVESAARTRATRLIASNTEQLLHTLATYLADVMAPVYAAVDEMPATVATAADAIAADCTAQWKTITAAVPILSEIRTVQIGLYTHNVSEDDRRKCGDMAGLDPQARLYYFRRIAEVVHDWRSGEMPWPTDPTERLLYVVQNDLEPWCPDKAQIHAAIEDLRSEGRRGARNLPQNGMRVTAPPPDKAAGPVRSMTQEPLVRQKPLRKIAVSSVPSASLPDDN